MLHDDAKPTPACLHGEDFSAVVAHMRLGAWVMLSPSSRRGGGAPVPIGGEEVILPQDPVPGGGQP